MKELIYIVEDDEGMQEVYEGAFEESYETKIFENGKDFFDVFNVKKPATDYGRIYHFNENS